MDTGQQYPRAVASPMTGELQIGNRDVILKTLPLEG